jgi:DnaK suppressor protein
MNRKRSLASLRDALLKRCDALRHDLAEEMLLSDLSSASIPGDLADLAVDNANEEARFLLGAAEVRELFRIERALDRIDQGRYGVCEVCDQPISSARMRAVPYATRCLSCQREAEEASGAVRKHTALKDRSAA